MAKTGRFGQRDACGSGFVRVVVYTVMVFGSLGTASAQNGDILRQVNHCSERAVDLCLDSVDNNLWVVDEISGQICQYTLTSQPPLQFVQSLTHPFGRTLFPSVFPRITGIAYNPDNDTLFILNVATLEVAEVDKANGEPVGFSFLISPPSADPVVSGLSYDALTGTLWYHDTHNEELVNCDLTGASLASIAVPRTVPNEILAGAGVSVTEDNGAVVLDVAHGTTLDFIPARTIRLGLDGSSRGVEVNLTAVLEPLRGIAYDRSSSLLYACSQTTVYQIDATIPAVLPPSAITCFSRMNGSIELRWTNHGQGPGGAYEGVTVTRSGETFTLEGSATSFVDGDTPLDAVITYEVAGIQGNNASDSACRVQTGTGALLDFVRFAGSRVFDLAFDPSRNRLYATDALSATGRIYVYEPSTLSLIEFFDTGFSGVRGIAYNPVIDRLVISRLGTALLQKVDPETGRVDPGAFPGGPLGTSIGAFTHDAFQDDYLYVNLDTDEVMRIEANPLFGAGTVIGVCTPAPVVGLRFGGALDSLDDGRFFSTVTIETTGQNAGVQRFDWNTPVCLATVPEINVPLDGLGGSLDVAGGAQGIAVVGDVLFVAGGASNSIFRVLLAPGGMFIRGDVDGDGNFTGIADAIFALNFQFQPGSASPPCLEAADADNDGSFNGVADAIRILATQFSPGAPPLPPPFPQCGLDDDSALGCQQSPGVCR